METTLDCKNGIQDHDYHRVRVRKSTGSNILGNKVTAYIEDWKCINCGDETIKLFKGSREQAEKINDTISEEIREEQERSKVNVTAS